MMKMAAVILSPYCGNNCIFCSSQPRVSKAELRVRVNAAIENCDYHILNGFDRIEISGNDPGEYADIHALVADFKHRGARFILLSTNGTRFASYRDARQLVDAGCDAIKIPLYGSNPEIHDSITRTPGSFKASRLALDNFKRLGLRIHINTVVVKQNKEDLKSLFSLALMYTDWQHIVFSLPCIARSDPDAYYVPAKDLQRYVLPLVCDSAKERNFVIFCEVPMCVFGFDYPPLTHGGPPRQGLQQPPAIFRSDLVDVPNYRLKKKIDMCRDCKVATKCDGFFANDIDTYGSGNLKAIS